MKKTLWSKTAAILAAFVILLTFGACGSKQAKDYGAASTYTADGSLNETADIKAETKAFSGAPEQADSPKLTYTGNRKIIRNASLDLSTEKYSATLKAIGKATAELGGYIEASHETKYDNYAYTSMTVRIPTEKLDEFLAKMDGAATVTSKSITSEDITASYIDTESHLKALRTEQDTLLELLSQANGLSEILEIQDRLTNVRSQIEYYQSLMNTYDNELEYSTVSIDVNEVKHEVVSGEGFWARIGAGLKESFYNVGTGIANFFSWVIIHIPYLLILGVILFAICVIIKKLKAKRKTKKEKKNAGQTDSADVSGQK
ncbi:MAG: DUF4349 domain-containing protein [Clostridia bacterium]|nr:DUF4349 domain-containing protein [Clostridia bacterium]